MKVYHSVPGSWTDALSGHSVYAQVDDKTIEPETGEAVSIDGHVYSVASVGVETKGFGKLDKLILYIEGPRFK